MEKVGYGKPQKNRLKPEVVKEINQRIEDFFDEAKRDKPKSIFDGVAGFDKDEKAEARESM